MTETRARYEVVPSRRRAKPAAPPSSGVAAAFPGCEPVPMNADQFARFERHVEHWDSRSEVAWMVRDTNIEHERPVMRLAALLYRMGQFRGAEIACCGTVSLHDRRPDGSVRVMEADLSIYLDAARARALCSPVLVQSGGAPDIALEVDNTTDARRRKLRIYEEWRIPEVWIDVPDAPARSRPKSRRPGLTIHALDAKAQRYRIVPASEALPGWTAAEIHLALNEPAISQSTSDAVVRVGRTLGRQEGTKPAEDPFLRHWLQGDESGA